MVQAKERVILLTKFVDCADLVLATLHRCGDTTISPGCVLDTAEMQQSKCQTFSWVYWVWIIIHFGIVFAIDFIELEIGILHRVW